GFSKVEMSAPGAPAASATVGHSLGPMARSAACRRGARACRYLVPSLYALLLRPASWAALPSSRQALGDRARLLDPLLGHREDERARTRKPRDPVDGDGARRRLAERRRQHTATRLRIRRIGKWRRRGRGLTGTDELSTVRRREARQRRVARTADLTQPAFHVDALSVCRRRGARRP